MFKFCYTYRYVGMHAEMKIYTGCLKQVYKYKQRYKSGNRWPRLVPEAWLCVPHTYTNQKEAKNSAVCVGIQVLTSDIIEEDISDIFLPTKNNLQIILAEGALCIGKTMLLKEIAYLWSTGHLLKK